MKNRQIVTRRASLWIDRVLDYGLYLSVVRSRTVARSFEFVVYDVGIRKAILIDPSGPPSVQSLIDSRLTIHKQTPVTTIRMLGDSECGCNKNEIIR